MPRTSWIPAAVRNSSQHHRIFSSQGNTIICPAHQRKRSNCHGPSTSKILSFFTLMLARCGECSRWAQRSAMSRSSIRSVGCLAFASHQPAIYSSRMNSCIAEKNAHIRRPMYSMLYRRQLSVCPAGELSDDPGHATDTDASISKKFFLDTIRQSLCADIVPKVLERNPHLSIPTDESPLVLVLAVSGGCDSVALFHAIAQLMENEPNSANNVRFISVKASDRGSKGIEGTFVNKIPCKVHVAHFDHQQRGEESDGDRIFVQDLCRAAGFEFHTYLWGNDESRAGIFSQKTARDWRRQKLSDLLDSLICKQRHGVILTAHHRDDCDETILLKLLRGVHITNLLGMDTVQQGMQGSSSIFAKPMLEISKDETERFLRIQGLQWREDSSNISDKYLRNRVRNEVLPLLSDLVGGQDILHRRLESLDEQSRKVKADLSLRAAQYTAKSEPSRSNPAAFTIPPGGTFSIVHEQALHTWAESQSGGKLILSYDHLKRICNQISSYPLQRRWSLDVGNKWKVKRNGDVILLEGEEEEAADGGGETIDCNDISWILFDDVESSGLHKDTKTKNISGSEVVSEHNLCISLTADDIARKFIVKLVEGNERSKFIPPWRKGRSPVKIKDFLRGQKIPLHERGSTPILCFADNADEIVLAVYLEDEHCDNGKWIIHADYEKTSGAISGSFIEIHLLRVRKDSKYM